MIDDIRLSLSFKTSRKKKKLFKALGNDGLMGLINLWLSAAENNQEGVLKNYTINDIELDAEWEGTPGLFVDACVDCGFIDYSDETKTYSLHNWSERQPWVYKSKDRADVARCSRLAKVNNDKYLELKENGINAISKEDYEKLTTPKRIVDESLTNGQQVVNDCVSPAPAPVPVPAPAPALSSLPAHNVKEKNLCQKNPKAQKPNLKEYLETGIEKFNLSICQEKICEFFHYRQSLPNAKRYKTEKGIDGLLKDVQGCINKNYNPFECIDYAMEHEWLTPSPEYFNNINLKSKQPLFIQKPKKETKEELDARLKALL